jgi:hypothetical protein
MFGSAVGLGDVQGACSRRDRPAARGRGDVQNLDGPEPSPWLPQVTALVPQ